MRAYLDYAGIGPLRERTRSAMRSALDDVLPHGSAQISQLFPARAAARATVARLLDCQPDEVAFVPNTSTGIHLVADGLDWHAGDEVVVFDGDFPANVAPWQRLEASGVRLVWVPMRAGGYELADVEAAIGPATRLIAASHVNFATGFRLDLDTICGFAREVGALVCIDAVQSIGVLPLSLSRTPVDFLACGGHKWLCGPTGTGIFYCRSSRLDQLRRVPSGWFGYTGAADMLTKGAGHLSYDLPLRPDVARVEGGMYDVLGMVGLAAALDELERVGVDAVSRRVDHLTQRLRAGLTEIGRTTVAAIDDTSWSGIVSFVDHDWGSVRIVEELVTRGIKVSVPDGKVRISPHYWTTDDEVDVFLESVRLVGS